MMMPRKELEDSSRFFPPFSTYTLVIQCSLSSKYAEKTGLLIETLITDSNINKIYKILCKTWDRILISKLKEI